jgi:hypothetical protein
MTPPKVAKQLDNEPTQDYIKFLVFLGMGTTRSLNKAYQQYYETTNEVPARWQRLAEQYRWTERASEHDQVNASPPPARASRAR